MTASRNKTTYLFFHSPQPSILNLALSGSPQVTLNPETVTVTMGMITGETGILSTSLASILVPRDSSAGM